MSDIETSSPAAEDGGASAPEALSLSSAAERLSEMDKREDEARAEQQSEPAPEDAEASQPADASEDSTDAADQDAADPASDGEKTNDEEPDEALDFDKLHGNTKLRLRDRSEVTVAELKRRYDDLRQVDDVRQRIEADRSQFENERVQFAQKAQFIEQIAPRAIALLQAQLPEIPPMPDLSLRETDFFEYTAQLDDRNRAIEAYHATTAEIQQVEQAAQLQARERQQHQQAAVQGYIEEQKTKLFEKNPDLRDPAKLKEFETDLYKYAQEAYNFPRQEVDGVYDHRLLEMMKDAIAYRKLKEKAPKPATPVARTSVPVSQPGRRVTAVEASSQKRSELVQRAKSKPGGNSLSDIASIFSQLESK